MKNKLVYIIKKTNSKLKSLLISLLEKGLTEQERLQLQRNSTFFSLKRLAKNGYNPSYIIDVGAHDGKWLTEAFKIFPKAKIIAVEPLPGKKARLEQIALHTPVKIYNVLLGAHRQKDVNFYSMETGSSVFKELTNFSNDAHAIKLDMLTLDEIAVEEKLKGKVLLKLDVQGYEMEVLKGAGSILQIVDFVCMEVSYINFNEGAPLADAMIPFMKNLGFVIYDIAGLMRKSNDFALVQSDIIFVRENSSFRSAINNLKDGNFKIMN